MALRSRTASRHPSVEGCRGNEPLGARPAEARPLPDIIPGGGPARRSNISPSWLDIRAINPAVPPTVLNAAQASGRRGPEEVRAAHLAFPRPFGRSSLLMRGRTEMSFPYHSGFQTPKPGSGVVPFSGRLPINAGLRKSEGARASASAVSSRPETAGRDSGQPTTVPTGLADTREPTDGKGAKPRRRQGFTWVGFADRLHPASFEAGRISRTNGPDGLGLKSGLVERALAGPADLRPRDLGLPRHPQGKRTASAVTSASENTGSPPQVNRPD